MYETHCRKYDLYTDVRVYSALSFQCFFFLIYTMSPATALTTALTHTFVQVKMQGNKRPILKLPWP